MVANSNLPMSVNLIFPTPVISFKLGRNLTQAETDLLINMPTRMNMGNVTSIDNIVLENKVLSDIAGFIKSSVNQCFDELYKPRKKVKLRITQSWLNYTKKDQFHHRHSHPNSFLSGVFYANANKDSDKIYFYDSRYCQITIPGSEHTPINSRSWGFPVETGDLVIFPSNLEHSVEVLTTDTVRASLAFNTFPVGYIGDDQELTGLHLRD
jgi:uncharacterized protein (TIGR02466 family)